VLPAVVGAPLATTATFGPPPKAGTSAGSKALIGTLAVIAAAAIAVAALFIGRGIGENGPGTTSNPQAPAAQASTADALADTSINDSGLANPGQAASPESQATDGTPEPNTAETPLTDTSTQPANTPQNTQYSDYYNARFGFRLSHPSQFIGNGESANGDGSTFHSPDSMTSVTAWGTDNVANRTHQEVRDSEIAAKENAGATITYKNSSTAKAIVISGNLASGEEYYEAIWVGSGSIVTMYWTAPTNPGENVSAWITEAYRTFAPGDLSQRH
jgi:hypothetical protein